MPSAWVIEGVDIVSDLSLGLNPGFVNGAPDHLGFDGSEHGFDHGIVVAVAFARHGYDEAMRLQEFLIIARAILAAAVAVMDHIFWRAADCNGAFQGRHCEILLEAIADCPANDPTREEVEHNGQIQPAFSRPDIADIHPPFLAGGFGLEVLIEHIGRNQAAMGAVGCSFETPFLKGFEAVLTHQASHAVPANSNAGLIEFNRHS